MNALILVDLQHDFMPGGALAVAEGDHVVPIANQLMPYFDVVIATQDWHPADHLSFASQHQGKNVGEVIELEGLQQVLWPDHCVQEKAGAELHEDLDASRLDGLVRKGVDRHIDSYSGFFDNGRQRETSLRGYLEERDIAEVFVMGLATDYCVKFTALDAVSLGLQTTLIVDGCRGVELQPGDIDAAMEELRSAGVQLLTSQELIEKQSKEK